MKKLNLKIVFDRMIRNVMLLADLVICIAAVTPSEQHTIDFSESDNLKAIFDAGLRPRQYLGLPGGCELQHENLKINLPGNSSFEMEIDSAEISVLAGNQIVEMDLACDPQPIAQAAVKARRLCEQLGIDTKNFDTYIEARGRRDFTVRSAPLPTNKGGVKVYLIFDDTSVEHARITVTLEWPIPDEKMEFITGPMKPPPGYENFSMAAPSEHDNQGASSPSAAQTSPGTTTESGALPNVTAPLSGAQGTSSKSPPGTTSPIAATPPPDPSWFTSGFGLLALLIAIIAAILGVKYATRKK